MFPTVPALPQELYGEIVAHLWDDIPSLKSCSLVNPIMTLSGQKILFQSVILRPARNLLLHSDSDGTSGTSGNFWQLLAHSPHIASYVRSIQIIDLKAQYAGSGGDGEDVGESDEGKEINLTTGTPI